MSTRHDCRLERALEELGGYRKAAGRSTTPDFNEEDRLRADLHNSEAQKQQLGQDSQALANLVLNLAHKQLTSQTKGKSGNSEHSLLLLFATALRVSAQQGHCPSSMSALEHAVRFLAPW